MNQAPYSDNTCMIYQLLLPSKTQLLKAISMYYLTQFLRVRSWKAAVIWVVLVLDSHESRCQPGMQDPFLRWFPHMFVKLVLATGGRSSGPLHRAAWNMEAPKEIKDKPWCFMTVPQSHAPPTAPYPRGYIHSLFNVGGYHTGHGHKEVRIPGGHYHNSGKQDSGEPVFKSYHSNSHPVCILHPSEGQGIKSISF